MPNFIEQIKQQGELEEGSFGHKPRDRDTPIQHSEFYKKLPVDDKELVEAVRQGKENAALISFEGDFLLFEHKEGGIARANGKKAGYQVYHCPQNQISSEDTLQSSLSQPQFFNNLQSSLSLLLMVIVLIGGFLLVYSKIDNIENPLMSITDNEINVLANRIVASKINLEGNETIVVKDVVKSIVMLVQLFNPLLLTQQFKIEQFKIALELASDFETNGEKTWRLKLRNEN